ncbi:MAG: lipid A biosynthesis lauroyl acyltransferase [Pseudomonadota bacterium]
MEPFIRKTYVLFRNLRDWVIAQLFFGFIAILKLFPADSAIWFCAEAARGLGMWYPRTKMARENLKLAFPEKSDEEIEEILREMWANLGRVAAEYVYLDKIFDIDEDDQSKGRVEITGGENFHAMKGHDGPAICFTGHTGNWEILPIASAAYGLNITALFRPPNNKYMAKRVLSARTTSMGHLVPSKAGASWALASAMDEGHKVGMLVDQFFSRGVEIEFLGRQTMGNPLLAKLARQYDCPVHPARCVRLPGGRFRIEIEPALDIPKNSDGSINVQALTQSVNDCVARWVRENPEQWLWLHKRWRPNFMAKRAEKLKMKKRST